MKLSMFVPISREAYTKIRGGDHLSTRDDCPFCEKEKNSGHTIRCGEYWYILHNLTSYSGDHRHIMAVPYTHLCYSTDLTAEHRCELAKVHEVVKDFFDNQDYFSFTRETMGSRSVEHLHIHFLVGKLEGEYFRKMLEMQGYPIQEQLELEL